MANIPDNDERPEDFSPYKLLENFSKSRVLPCIFLALLLHVLIIGGTSYGYIYRTWIAKETDKTAEKNGESSETPSEGEASETATPEGAAEKNGKAETGTDKTGEPETPGDGDIPPIIKEITEKPKPGEIPKEPDGLNISLEDTNS